MTTTFIRRSCRQGYVPLTSRLTSRLLIYLICILLLTSSIQIPLAYAAEYLTQETTPTPEFIQKNPEENPEKEISEEDSIEGDKLDENPDNFETDDKGLGDGNLDGRSLADAREYLAIETFACRRVRFDFYVGSYAAFRYGTLTPSRHVYVSVPCGVTWDGIESFIPPETLRHFPSSRYFSPELLYKNQPGCAFAYGFIVVPRNNITLLFNISTGRDRRGDINHEHWVEGLRVDGFRQGQVVTLEEITAIIRSRTDFPLELYGAPRLLRNGGLNSITVNHRAVWNNSVTVFFPLRHVERTLTFHVFELDKEVPDTAALPESARIASFTTTLNLPASLVLDTINAGWLNVYLSNYSDYWRSDFPLYAARDVGNDTVYLIFREGACPSRGGMCVGDCNPPTGPPYTPRVYICECTEDACETKDTGCTRRGPATGEVAHSFAQIAAGATLAFTFATTGLIRTRRKS